MDMEVGADNAARLSVMGGISYHDRRDSLYNNSQIEDVFGDNKYHDPLLESGSIPRCESPSVYAKKPSITPSHKHSNSKNRMFNSTGQNIAPAGGGVFNFRFGKGDEETYDDNTSVNMTERASEMFIPGMNNPLFYS